MKHLFDRGMTRQEPYDIAKEYDDARLAKYAVKNSVGFGRVHPEVAKEEEDRMRFFIDVGRAIHAGQVKALLGKAQVYPTTVPERVSSRGTHSPEVAHLSRGIARSLRLNEDLAEVGGLLHDVGHPPFGHEGECALDQWARMHGLRFEHNAQTLRIVTTLEDSSPGRRGMNLNIETLRVLDKHGTGFGWDRNADEHFPYAFLEAGVVNIADAIEYFSGDAEDALRHGIMDRDMLARSALFKRAMAIADGSGRGLRSELIHLLTRDLTTETRRQIDRQRIVTLRDVVAATEPVVRFSPQVEQDMKELKTLMYDKMYRPPEKKAYRAAVHSVLNTLCVYYHTFPNEQVLAYEELSDHTDPNQVRVQAVLDYVSSLTDREATIAGKEVGVPAETIDDASTIYRANAEEREIVE